MTIANDKHFWDQSAKKYSTSPISDQAGYQRTLDRTRALLGPSARTLELGFGTGTTALLLAPSVQSYLATDISSEMIAIAVSKPTTAPNLAFRTATADDLGVEPLRYTAVLAFKYLHLVRDLPGTLQKVHGLLEDGGLFVSKTPCIAEMNPLLRMLVLPVTQALRLAPYVSCFRAEELESRIREAGFEVLVMERHVWDAQLFLLTIPGRTQSLQQSPPPRRVDFCQEPRLILMHIKPNALRLVPVVDNLLTVLQMVFPCTIWLNFRKTDPV